MQPEAAENTAAPQKKSRPQIRGLAVEMYAQGRVTTAGFASLVCVCVECVYLTDRIKVANGGCTCRTHPVTNDFIVLLQSALSE